MSGYTIGIYRSFQIEIKNLIRQYPIANDIVEAVACSYDITLEDLKSRKRDACTAEARQVAMYLLWNANGYTLEQIGKNLGGRTPATVSHGFQRVARRISNDEELRAKVDLIKRNCELV